MNTPAAPHTRPLTEPFSPTWTWRSIVLALSVTLTIYLVIPYLEKASKRPQQDLLIRTLDTRPIPLPPPEIIPVPKSIHQPRLTPPKPRLSPPAQSLSLPSVNMNLGVTLGALRADTVSSFHISDAGLTAQIQDMIFDFGELDDPPRPITRLQPLYPQDARRRRMEGVVTLEFIVSPDGTTRDIAIVHSSPGDLFNEAALRAVRRWRFSPGTQQGQAVSTRVRQKVNFTLQ